MRYKTNDKNITYNTKCFPNGLDIQLINNIIKTIDINPFCIEKQYSNRIVDLLNEINDLKKEVNCLMEAKL